LRQLALANFVIFTVAIVEAKKIHISNPKVVDKIKQIIADKAHIHQKIREGMLSEINSHIKFVKPI
jgi:hypothetical protein